MVLIFAGSSDVLSAEHTSRFIQPFLRWLMPDISQTSIALIQLYVRKAAHVTEYAILAALLLRAFRPGKITPGWRHLLSCCLIASLWAGLDEYHQSFVASRTGSPIDVMIDATGALLGLFVYWWFSSKRTRAITA